MQEALTGFPQRASGEHIYNNFFDIGITPVFSMAQFGWKMASYEVASRGEVEHMHPCGTPAAGKGVPLEIQLAK